MLRSVDLPFGFSTREDGGSAGYGRPVCSSIAGGRPKDSTRVLRLRDG